MTDEFERQLGDMLRDRVADLPASYEVEPSTLRRARRRRGMKLAAFSTALVLVVAGVAGVAAVVAVVNGSGSDNVVSTAGTRPSVDTIRCPSTGGADAGRPPGAPPVIEPRVPTAGDPGVLSHLVSYAAFDDPRYVVLGPAGWYCSTILGTDGQNGMVVGAQRSSGVDVSGISIVNDYLWHGGVGSTLACSASDDPAVRRYVERNFPDALPCPTAGRALTRVDAHTQTFVDPDGTRGAAWIVLPSGDGADDGKLSVLTCHPVATLTTADCDTIVADWVARIGSAQHGPATTVPRVTAPTVTETTVPSASQVATVACPITYNITPDTPLAPPSTTPRSVPGDSSVLSGFASYASTDDPRYVVLVPKGWACHTIIGTDGQNVSLLAPTGPRTSLAEVSIVNDFLWHGAVGSEVACWVTTDPRVQRYVQENYPELAPSCHRTGRTITQVDAHITTFVDPSTRGAALIVLPSSDRADDGKVSVLTCHASDPGITVAECDAIVADWVGARPGAELMPIVGRAEDAV